MASRVSIGYVSSYSSKTEIRTFIESVFDSNPDINSLFTEGNTDRLIVVKPNWVQEAHEHDPTVWEPVITNPNVIIAVVEVLIKRMNGQGTICICDAPHTYASFEDILSCGGLKKRLEDIRHNWNNFNLEVLDLRREVWIRKEDVVVGRRPNKEDPRGYVRLDLKKNSLFYGHPGEGRYYGADYDSRIVNEHHSGETQEYLLSGTAMACDLFINLPKMKTHKKTGITCCLKNLVGINGDKNWLPHHTEGSPASHGDEFPKLSFKNRIESSAKQVGKKVALNVPLLGTWIYRKMRNAGKQVLGDSETVIRNGNWSGNDTCWRMALDLNRALLYVNPDGTWRDCFKPKAYLAIVDGIIGGQGNGPLCPDPVCSNVLVSGINPAEVDAVVARLMGFDPQKIPIIKHAFDAHRWPLTTRKMEEIIIFDERVGSEVGLDKLMLAVEGGFVPHFGWSTLKSGDLKC